MVQKARNAEILQTAARVFRQKGFHATRIQDIADELGMRKGSLYHYISSKEDLVQGLVAGVLERMIEETSSILATGHSARRKLAMAIEAHLRLTLEDRDIWGILMRENLELLNRNSPPTSARWSGNTSPCGTGWLPRAPPPASSIRTSISG